MQDHLASATKHHIERSNDNRLGRVTKTHRGVLEDARHHIEIFPVFVLGFHEHQHDVGAHTEVRSLIADHQADKILFHFADGKLQHLQRIAADCVHLRVKLEAGNSVADVHKRCAGVFLDHTLLLFD